MKKIFSVLMVMVLVLSATLIAGCGAKSEPLKIGLGVATSVTTTDATEDKDGQGQATFTAAAVLIDAEGKIVKAAIDCADNKVGFKADGTAVTVESFKTKYEQGANYGMVAYGNATKEWYEQVDAFCALIVGKTADEVKALVAETAKGTDEVINAGCTIYISDFALAIEKAVANAIESNATANDTLKLGASTAQSTTDATEDKDGSNQVETSFFAAAINAEGKVTAASSDCVQVKFTFNTAGASTFDTTKPVSTKKEQGANYGMVAYGNAAKEWDAQAAAFDAICVGKTVEEIKGLVLETGKGNDDVVNAGCTIIVDGFVKAASKIG